MSNASRDTAAESISMRGLDVRLENLEGGYTVCFESHTADQDLTPLFQGLPDHECQFERLGYVVAGIVEFRTAGRTDIYTAGDAYYVPPGHVPIHHEGAQIVEFSPTEMLGETMEVVLANVQQGRRPQPLISGR